MLVIRPAGHHGQQRLVKHARKEAKLFPRKLLWLMQQSIVGKIKQDVNGSLTDVRRRRRTSHGGLHPHLSLDAATWSITTSFFLMLVLFLLVAEQE